MRWTEGSILDAVEAHFTRLEPCWMIRQVEHAGRRLDGLVVYPDGRRKAIEAKTSRADYRNETPAKRYASEVLAHECWYAAPPGVIAAPPPGWGLLMIESVASVVALPRTRRPSSLSDQDFARIVGRLAHLERRLAGPETAEERAAALDMEVDRLAALLATQRAATARETARAEDAAEQVMLASGEPLVCTVCGDAIRYTRVHGWRHERKAAGEACDALRAEAERRRREVLTGAAYLTSEAPRIRPIPRPGDR